MTPNEEDKNDAYEELINRMISLQSKFEHEMNALEGLINIAHKYAEDEDNDLAYLLGELKNKIKNIQKLVYQ